MEDPGERVKKKIEEIYASAREMYGPAPTLEQHVSVLCMLVATLLVKAEMENEQRAEEIERMRAIKDQLRR